MKGEYITMSILMHYPTNKDRQDVHNLIGMYAHGKLGRNDMMRWVANIISKYPNIQRIPINGYSVRIASYYEDLPIISIEGAIISNACPECTASLEQARYLRTEREGKDYDIVSAACLECGCVYMFKGGKN
jgi:hypothetical protein